MVGSCSLRLNKKKLILKRYINLGTKIIESATHTRKHTCKTSFSVTSLSHFFASLTCISAFFDSENDLNIRFEFRSSVWPEYRGQKCMINATNSKNKYWIWELQLSIQYWTFRIISTCFKINCKQRNFIVFSYPKTHNLNFIRFGNSVISPTSEIKFLGITIDQNL